MVSGPDADAAVGFGFAGTMGGTVGIESVGDAAGFVLGAQVAPVGQAGSEFGVDLGAVFGGEVGGFSGNESGAPLGGGAGGEGGQGVGEFVDEAGGQADVSTAFRGAVLSGKGDLRVDGAAGVGRGDAAAGQ